MNQGLLPLALAVCVAAAETYNAVCVDMESYNLTPQC